MILNTEVGVVWFLVWRADGESIAGSMRTTTAFYNLLFLTVPRPALIVSVIPQGWQLRLLIVIRLPAAKGNVSRPYVCCCNIQLLSHYLIVARDCCVYCYYWRKIIVGD
jgi:hypothetical protein